MEQNDETPEGKENDRQGKEQKGAEINGDRGWG